MLLFFCSFLNVFSFLSSLYFLAYYLVDSCRDQGIKIISLVSYSVSLFFITSYSGIPCYKAAFVVRSSSCFWPHGLQHASLPVTYHLPKFAQVHVHCIGDAIQSSHPIMSSHLMPLQIGKFKSKLQRYISSHLLGWLWSKNKRKNLVLLSQHCF